jgi:hypothetical protein
MGIQRWMIEHLLMTEYAVCTQLGWHRDVPHYEFIVGISLGSQTALGVRRYPPNPATNRQSLKPDVARRSTYSLQDEARWGWQHCVPLSKNRAGRSLFALGDDAWFRDNDFGALCFPLTALPGKEGQDAAFFTHLRTCRSAGRTCGAQCAIQDCARMTWEDDYLPVTSLLHCRRRRSQ